MEHERTGEELIDLTPAAFERPALNFCPIGGLVGGESAEFAGLCRALLRQRLKLTASLLLAGFAAFLVHSLTLRDSSLYAELWGFHAQLTLALHAGVTVVLAAVTALLITRRELSAIALRGCELVVFGLSGAFFLWVDYCQACHAVDHSGHLQGWALAYPAEVAVTWVMLIILYGLFIPNRCRRAIAVLAVLVLAPLTGALLAGAKQPEIGLVLRSGGFLQLSIWLALAAATAIYGSNRYAFLQRAAFDAMELGVYSLIKKLGSGGMGDVYLATHRLLKRTCAIKLIRPEKAGDENAIARFESEVQATAQLTHLNTIEIYDYGRSKDGTFFYVMEYLPGLNLQELVERYGPLPPERVISLLRAVCSALAEAHDAGLIHRDIKPGNIFAAERGGIHDVAKLLDFGLVKSLTNGDVDSLKLTLDGAVVGSPLYASPEAVVGEESPGVQADIYSIGATAYFLLSGQPVFEGSNPLKVLFAHANATPTPLSERREGIPADLERVILTCLEKNPADRFENVRELEAALADCACPNPWTTERATNWWSTRSAEPRGGTQDPTTGETATQIVPVPG